MHYWSDEVSGVCVCKMAEQWDEKKKSNLEHALDYICGRISRRIKSRVTDFSWIDVDYHVRELLEPFVKKHIKDEYKGMARCSSTDKFEYNVGQSIARARCLEAFYADLTDAIAEIGELLQNVDDVNYSAFNSSEESWSYWDSVANSAN